MKTTVLTIAAIFASLNIFAQGTVNFSNNGLNAPVVLGVPITITYPTGTVAYAVGAKAPAGTTFSVALYYAPYNNGVMPDPATLFQIGMVVGQPVSANLSKAGIYFAGAFTAPTVNVPPGGGLGWFQVKAWETVYGMTYEAALPNPNNLSGFSNIIAVNTANPLVTPPGTPSLLTGISGITLNVVPEPAILGLGLLGGVAMLLLRRRK
jgi:hypothetical protein